MTTPQYDISRVERLTAQQLSRTPPRSQEDYCLIAARVSIEVYGAPRSDIHVIQAAAGTAKGLFGPAFEKADGDQRSRWIDMCEEAFRKAMREESIYNASIGRIADSNKRR
jgi:hypothetical protein